MSISAISGLKSPRPTLSPRFGRQRSHFESTSQLPAARHTKRKGSWGLGTVIAIALAVFGGNDIAKDLQRHRSTIQHATKAIAQADVPAATQDELLLMAIDNHANAKQLGEMVGHIARKGWDDDRRDKVLGLFMNHLSSQADRAEMTNSVLAWPAEYASRTDKASR